jgi:aspartate ammonia-lyase
MEQDFLGEKEIPAGAYWGVHTARALENFTASGTPVSVHPTLVAGLGSVKLAAARANRELGLIDHRRASAIERACQDSGRAGFVTSSWSTCSRAEPAPRRT